MANIRVVIQKPINSSAVGVESVTGQGVDNSDPQNPVLSFPDSDDITNNSGVTGATVSDALETLQGEQLNPNNFVNQFNTNTQGVSGRFTIQTPIDADTSDAANVGYVLGKTNNKVNSVTTGEPTGASVIGNIVEISQSDYDTAQAAGNLNSTTLYLTPNV